MKKKWLGIASVACAASMFVAVSLVSASDNGPEKITINSQETHPDISTGKDKKKVADFQHHKHQNEFVKGKEAHALFKYTDDWTCGACHHTDKKGETPVACLSCKDVKKMLDHKEIKGKVDKMYHNLCRDACHKKNDKETAKCKFCHGE